MYAYCYLDVVDVAIVNLMVFYFVRIIVQYKHHRIQICACLFHGETASDLEIIPSLSTIKDESLNREPVCGLVTLFKCVTLLSVVPQQREPSSHGTSSITLFCWTTIPQGKSLVWPSWLSMMQFSFFVSPKPEEEVWLRNQQGPLLLLKVICLHTVFPHQSSA